MFSKSQVIEYVHIKAWVLQWCLRNGNLKQISIHKTKKGGKKHSESPRSEVSG